MDLNVDNLLNILSLANESERNSRQQEAENQLKTWEVVPGYHYYLQSIYLNLELPLQIRWLAIICFKNGVEKYWRSSRTNAISKDEKSKIKSRLFSLLHEKNNQLMIQHAHSIGKIVRFEFPTEWPNLFEEIERSLHNFVFVNQDLSSVNNLLIILNQIIKTLSSVRIGRARHAMQSKSPLIVPLLIKLYVKFFQQWTNNLDLALMEVCYLCLKNLRRIIPEGFEQPETNHDVTEFLKVSVDHLRGLINEHSRYSSDLIERYAKCYSKLYFNLISINPTSFILLPCCETILSYYMNYLQENAERIYQSNEENDFWEIIALKGFLILKKVINYTFKQGSITLKQPKSKQEIEIALKKLASGFFNKGLIEKLCDLIINWYLPIKPNDLENWSLEPEEWCNEEFQSSWEYQIRPCAENFFQDLVKFFKDDLSNYILNKISNNLNDGNILIQDSILCTFQLSADSISDKVNFNQLLNDVFVPLGSKNDKLEQKILKRRICLIINEWVVINCSNESRILIYKFLSTLLVGENKINDQVVKLNAIQCLKTIINDWDFNKKDFGPFLTEFITRFIEILDEMTFTESKLYILNTLAIVIERCNPLINYETLIRLLAIIPKYWEVSNSNDNEVILKTSLIRILKNLIISLNENSPETYSICIPLIKSCCSENSDYQLLSEDGYELWLSMLQFCPNQHKEHVEIIQLFELIKFGLLNSTEVLPLILSIIRSYSLLSPEVFQIHSINEIFKVLSGYLNSMRDDAFNVFISLMDILILKLYNDEVFLTSLVDSGLFNCMLSYVLDESNSIVCINKLLLILSRLAFANNEIFLKMLNYLSNDINSFLKHWTEYYVNNGNPRNKKINLLGLLSLLKITIPIKEQNFISIFPDVIKKTFLFLEEVKETDGKVDAYNLDFIYEDIDDYRYLDPDIKENGEKTRYVELLDQADPVFKVQLDKFLIEVIHSFKSTLANDEFDQLMNMNEEYSIEQLQKIM